MVGVFGALRSDGVRIARSGGELLPGDTVGPERRMFGDTFLSYSKDTGGQLRIVGVEGRPHSMDRRLSPWPETGR
jgi:hypothetical protein